MKDETPIEKYIRRLNFAEQALRTKRAQLISREEVASNKDWSELTNIEGRIMTYRNLINEAMC